MEKTKADQKTKEKAGHESAPPAGKSVSEMARLRLEALAASKAKVWFNGGKALASDLPLQEPDFAFDE